MDEVYEIAENGGMKLYFVDYHIEMSNLLAAQKKPGLAKEHKEKAREWIEKTGYKLALNRL